MQIYTFGQPYESFPSLEKESMKNGLFLLLGSLLFISCDNTLDVTASYEPTTVLYSILDPTADTNFVRVQRGYLTDDNPQQYVRNSDSLYYDSAEIEVYLREYNREETQVLKETPLRYFDDVVLDSGTFTGENHHLYRVPSNVDLAQDKKYEVAVVRPDGSEASGRTGIVGNIDIRQPPDPVSIRFFTGRIEFDVDQGSAPLRAYQVNLILHYREFNLQTRDSLYRSTVIDLPLLTTDRSSVELLFDRFSLARAVGNRLEPKENVIRFFESLSMEIYGGADELVTYFQVNKPSQSINQNRPTFDRITNGTGLVSSRFKRIRTDIKLEQQKVYQTLQTSDQTCDLRFVEVQRGRDTCFCVDGEETCL
jgi:hypothetical protein